MYEVRMVPAAAIDEVNRMCLPQGVKEGAALEAVLRESAAAHARAEAMGARVFGAFLEGGAVGRIEVMPIETAPLPLQGEDLWAIRCLWVLPPGERKGIGRALVSVEKARPDEDGCVHVEAVLSARCPWLMLSCRRLLAIAREMSPQVVTTERVITNRADALAFGEEGIYIDGEPLQGGPGSDAFRQQLHRKLQARGLV